MPLQKSLNLISSAGQDHNVFSTKSRFLQFATVFEGGMILIAYALGWLVDIDPLADFIPEPEALALGILGTMPLYILFALTYAYPNSAMRDIKRFLVEKLGPILHRCRWQELLYLGFVAGVSEEILFRGVLQPWLAQYWGMFGGLLFSNMIFALAHWVTPWYGLLAGLTGIYLGLSMNFGAESNILVPILIHSVYDFLAFLAVAASYKKGFPS